MPDPAHVEATVGHWLTLLRDGTEEQRLLARTELGLILEARGLLDEAVAAYERNVEAGVADRRPYERLAALARARGDLPTEARVLRALADLIAPPPTPPEDIAPTDPAFLDAAPGAQAPNPSAEEPSLSRSDADEDDPPSDAGLDVRPLDEVSDPTPEPSSSEVEAPGSQPLADECAASVIPPADDLPPSSEAPDGEENPHPNPLPEGEGDGEGEGRRVGEGARSLRVVLTALALPVLVLLIGALVTQMGRPVEAPSALPSGSPTTLAVAASPTAVELRLAADVPVVLSSPTATVPPTPTPAPTLTPTPLPTRCADAELRFPETRDSEGAVRAAYRDYLARQGVTLGPGTAHFGELAEAYAARHAEVVAGWIAVTLQRERRGLPAFTLAEYVASDVIVAIGPGEYQLRATISPQGWTEIRSWPANTCEGAFIRDPANARWVELMEASVGDITWALPTPPLTR